MAQFTTVTGTIVDPNGLPYANALVSAVLVTSASPTFTATALPYTPPTQPAGTNSAGFFIMNLADNTALSPAGTKWNFKVSCGSGCILPSGGTGPQSFTLAAPITITGATQDVSANLNAVAPALGFVVAATSAVGGKWANTPAAPLPSPLCNSSTTFLPAGLNPYWFAFDATNACWRPENIIDNTASPPAYPEHMEQIDSWWISDCGILAGSCPQFIKNSLSSIYHEFPNSSRANSTTTGSVDDRALGIQAINATAAHLDTTTHSTLYDIYAELNLYGNPSYSGCDGGSPIGTVVCNESIGVNLTDNRTASTTAIDVGIRSTVEINSPTLGFTSCGLCGAAMAGNLILEPGNGHNMNGNLFAGTYGSVTDPGAAFSNYESAGLYGGAPPTTAGVGSASIFAADAGTGTNLWSLLTQSLAAGSGRVNFSGPVLFDQGVLGAVSPSAITTPASGIVLVPVCGTACTQVWGYKAVANDALGGWDGVHTLTFTTGATQNGTLSASNYNEVLLASGGGYAAPSLGIYSLSIYRTVSGGTPSSLGYIGQLVCNLAALAPCLFKDTGLPVLTCSGTSNCNVEPTVPNGANNSGAIGGFSVRDQAGPCKVNSASPAACGGAWSGTVVVPTTTTTYTVNTTAVTSSSEITVQFITDNTLLPSAPTCTTPAAGYIGNSSRVSGTSFTFTLPSTAGSTCVVFLIHD